MCLCMCVFLHNPPANPGCKHRLIVQGFVLVVLSWELMKFSLKDWNGNSKCYWQNFDAIYCLWWLKRRSHSHRNEQLKITQRIASTYGLKVILVRHQILLWASFQVYWSSRYNGPFPSIVQVNWMQLPEDKEIRTQWIEGKLSRKYIIRLFLESIHEGMWLAFNFQERVLDTFRHWYIQGRCILMNNFEDE